MQSIRRSAAAKAISSGSRTCAAEQEKPRPGPGLQVEYEGYCLWSWLLSPPDAVAAAAHHDVFAVFATVGIAHNLFAHAAVAVGVAVIAGLFVRTAIKVVFAVIGLVLRVLVLGLAIIGIVAALDLAAAGGGAADRPAGGRADDRADDGAFAANTAI